MPWLRQDAGMCTRVNLHARAHLCICMGAVCACFVCARGAPAMWMASASISQSPPTRRAVHKGLEAVQVSVRRRPCPPGAGHSGALSSRQQERQAVAETPGRTEMHPEVQMHQMLFWKMSLASIPGGGSRGRGAGARYMQVGRGKSEEPGLGGGGE